MKKSSKFPFKLLIDAVSRINPRYAGRTGMKKYLTGIITAGVIVGTLSACAAAGAQNETTEAKPAAEQEDAMQAEYHKISAEDAKKRMDSGDDIIILDVRTQDEYEAGHIPGAILLPNETIGTGKPDKLPDTEQEILVYCRSGSRSAQAAKKLVEAGYTQIYDFGGIIDWPYDTVNGDGQGIE